MMNLNSIINALFKLSEILLLIAIKIAFILSDAIGDLVHLLVFSKREKSVKNEYVLITGSAGYLGRHLALEFAKRGAKLILVDRNEQENKHTLNDLITRGYSAQQHVTYTLDLCNETEVRQCWQEVLRKFGNVAIVVMAAAPPFKCASILDTFYSSDIERHYTLGYLSQLWTYQEFLPTMCKQKRGHFVTISSSSSILDVPFISSYASAKVAQAKLSETVREEFIVNGLTTNVRTTVVYMQLLKGGVADGFDGAIEFDASAGITGQYAAKNIVSGVLNNVNALFVPCSLQLQMVLKYMFTPRLLGHLVAFSSKFNEKLLKLKQF